LDSWKSSGPGGAALGSLLDICIKWWGGKFPPVPPFSLWMVFCVKEKIPAGANEMMARKKYHSS